MNKSTKTLTAVAILSTALLISCTPTDETTQLTPTPTTAATAPAPLTLTPDTTEPPALTPLPPTDDADVEKLDNLFEKLSEESPFDQSLIEEPTE